MLLLLCVPAFAQTSIFTVQGVKVDVTASNAAKAQSQAFRKAQREAFDTLVLRILSEDEQKSFVSPDSNIISTLVKDFEITEEKLSSVRYVGTYTFRFQGDAVREYMASHGINYTDVSSKPVLILPFYQWGAQTYLWDDNNPWRAAWNRSSNQYALVPIVVPIGDLEDVSDIKDSDTLYYDKSRLDNMVERYGAGEAVILLARPRWTNSYSHSNERPAAIDVEIYRTKNFTPEFVTVVSGEVSGDNMDAVFDEIVVDVRSALQKEWKSRTIIDPSKGNYLKVRVRFEGMKEWVDTHKALQNVQGIHEVHLLSLSPKEANLELVFRGSEQRLRLALSQADMTLTTPSLDFSGIYLGADASARRSLLIYDLFLNKYDKSDAWR
jgi:hypothetical protein